MKNTEEKRDFTNSEWRGFCRTCEKLAAGISGGTVFRVRDIPYPNNLEEIGYTSKNRIIHLSRNNPIFDELDIIHKIAFIKGVFAHELMHGLNTDFNAFYRALEKTPEFERQIFSTIFNVMEDPAIEHFASHYFGGGLLKALNYSINFIYKHSPSLEEAESPLSQWIAAAIQYGDGGFLHGEFTFDEAKKYFYKALPLLDETIDEPCGEKRVKLAQQTFQMIKPLWADQVEDAKKWQEFMEELKKFAEKTGKDLPNLGGDKPCERPCGEPITDENADGKDGKDEGTSIKEKRRIVTRKKIEEDISKESSEGTKSGKASKDDSAEENSKEASTSKKSKKTEDAEGKEGAKSAEGSENSDAASEGAEDNIESENGSCDSESSGKAQSDSALEGNPSRLSKDDDEDFDDSEDLEIDYDKEGIIDDTEYELTDEDFAELEQEIDHSASLDEMENVESSESETIVDYSNEISKRYKKHIDTMNVVTKGDSEPLEEYYQEVLSKIKPSIDKLTKQLRRLFMDDQEEREYRSSGSINVKRLMSGRMTARVFDRRVAPKNKSDLAIELVVDISGSMSGDRIVYARETALGLSEVFANLNIPTKVMAFTGDCSANGDWSDRKTYDVVMYHFLNWHTSKSERRKILSLKAMANNFDGYSIRYAAKELKERKEAHKMMIVISDGQPACYYYRSSTEGVSDTANAIREASKDMTVMGIAIGADRETLYSMYKDKFVEVERLEGLFDKLGQKIRKEISQW